MEASDWLEVEELVRGFAVMGREQLEIRVSWTTTCGVPPPSPEEEDSDDEDDALWRRRASYSHGHQQYYPLAADSITPTLLSGLPAKETQQTATLFLRNSRNSSFVIEP